MKCKCCGAEIIRIHKPGGPAACWAQPVTYWKAENGAVAREVLTPNGESIYGVMTGKVNEAIGIGYLPHTCHQIPLIYQGRDSWSRPVYQGPSGRFYVDVDPRKDRKPDICTKQGNTFDGEPCDPVASDFDFIPFRDTW